jgi:hypothetical protein
MTDINATEASAELEAAPTDAERADAPAQAAPETETPAAAPEFAFPVGSASQLAIDCFLDAEGDAVQLSMTQLKALLPHIAGNTIESACRRLFERGHLQRISPGIYRLAQPTAAPVKPEPQPDGARIADAERADGVQKAAQQREEALERDRQRKKAARERDRPAAFHRQAEADAALRDTLIAACNGN